MDRVLSDIAVQLIIIPTAVNRVAMRSANDHVIAPTGMYDVLSANRSIHAEYQSRIPEFAVRLIGTNPEDDVLARGIRNHIPRFGHGQFRGRVFRDDAELTSSGACIYGHLQAFQSDVVGWKKIAWERIAARCTRQRQTRCHAHRASEGPNRADKGHKVSTVYRLQRSAQACDNFAGFIDVINASNVAENNVVSEPAFESVIPLIAEDYQRQGRACIDHLIVPGFGIQSESTICQVHNLIGAGSIRQSLPVFVQCDGVECIGADDTLLIHAQAICDTNDPAGQSIAYAEVRAVIGQAVCRRRQNRATVQHNILGIERNCDDVITGAGSNHRPCLEVGPVTGGIDCQIIGPDAQVDLDVL